MIYTFLCDCFQHFLLHVRCDVRINNDSYVYPEASLKISRSSAVHEVQDSCLYPVAFDYYDYYGKRTCIY